MAKHSKEAKGESTQTVRQYVLKRGGRYGYSERAEGFVFATESDGVVTRQREVGDLEFNAITSDKRNFEIL